MRISHMKTLLIRVFLIFVSTVSKKSVCTPLSRQLAIPYSRLIQFVGRASTTKPSLFLALGHDVLNKGCKSLSLSQEFQACEVRETRFSFANPLVSTCFIIHHSPEGISTKGKEDNQLQSFSNPGCNKVSRGRWTHKRHLAATMEEQQRKSLDAALVKLDKFCRTFFSLNDRTVQTEEKMLLADRWNHTIFPQGFQALSRYLEEENTIGESDNVEESAMSASEGGQCNLVERQKFCDRSVFHIYCDMLSKLLGIPCGPARKHVPPKSKNETKVRQKKKIVEDVLELPADEIIEIIAKQIGRFPYGLLSVARARELQADVMLSEGSYSPDMKERNKHSDLPVVPQVLAVSPFWIADRPHKKSKTAEPLTNARQRVIDSVARLQSSGIDFNHIVPFPTTFWLCDSRLTAKLSEAELTGWIKNMENGVLLEDTDLRERVIHDNIRFIALRWLLIPRVFLSHFYAANRRCKMCVVNIPEGYTSCEYASGSFSHGDAKHAQNLAAGEDEMQTSHEGDPGNRGETCAECVVCHCKLCKLLNCHRSRGVGGLMSFCRIRCLHMQYAYHLACPTTIGNMIDDSFGIHLAID